MDLNNSTISEILGAVDRLELDPLLAINEERAGRNRKTLITALEMRIEKSLPPETVILPSEEDDEVPADTVVKKETDSPLPPELYVSTRGIIKCRLKSDSPAKVTFRGSVNCTFMKRVKPYAVPREYWLAVLKRTGLFEEIN